MPRLYLFAVLIICISCRQNDVKEKIEPNEPVEVISKFDPPSNWKTIDTDKFFIQYPEGWEREPFMGDYVLLSLYLSKNSEIGLLEESLSVGQDSDVVAYSDIMLENVKKDFPEGNMVVIENKAIECDSVSYRKLIFTITKYNHNLEVEEWMYIENNKACQIIFTTLQSNFAESQKLAEEIFSTVEIND